MAAPSTPPNKVRSKDEDSSSSISPVQRRDSPYNYVYASGKVIRGGDVVTYNGVLATVLCGNGGANMENPQVKIQQEDGKICCPSAQRLVFVRRPAILPLEPIFKEDQTGGYLSPAKPALTPPVVHHAPAPLVVQLPPAQLSEDQELIGLFSRLNVHDKELVKGMISRLAHTTAVSMPTKSKVANP